MADPPAEPGTDLPLPERAGYRLILAVMKGQKLPFVVGGAMGLAVHTGLATREGLEVYLREDAATPMLSALANAGCRITAHPSDPCAKVTYGVVTARVWWGLPLPLTNRIDDAWFLSAKRARVADLKVFVAPAEELLWIRLASERERSSRSEIGDIVAAAGSVFDWPRLLSRVSGLESLLLSHLFLLFHTQRAEAEKSIPAWVITGLFEKTGLGVDSEGPMP